MKNHINTLLFMAMAILCGTLVTSCQAVGDIFGAGVYVGVFLMVMLLVVFVVVITRLGKK